MRWTTLLVLAACDSSGSVDLRLSSVDVGLQACTDIEVGTLISRANTRGRAVWSDSSPCRWPVEPYGKLVVAPVGRGAWILPEHLEPIGVSCDLVHDYLPTGVWS